MPLLSSHTLPLHKNSCIKLSHASIQKETMAASTTSLSSRGFSSAQFVAGSRRPASSSKKRFASSRRNNDVKDVRASSMMDGKKEEVCGENADESESTTVAGKAVSAVVAAAISLSSAGQAAVAQVVRFCCSRSPCFFSMLFASFDSNTNKNRDTISKSIISSVIDRVFRINWKVCVLSFLFSPLLLLLPFLVH